MSILINKKGLVVLVIQLIMITGACVEARLPS
jgi:hypothetical protein